MLWNERFASKKEEIRPFIQMKGKDVYKFVMTVIPPKLDELMQIVKGPDFPTGAMILGKEGIKEAIKFSCTSKLSQALHTLMR